MVHHQTQQVPGPLIKCSHLFTILLKKIYLFKITSVVHYQTQQVPSPLIGDNYLFTILLKKFYLFKITVLVINFYFKFFFLTQQF